MKVQCSILGSTLGSELKDTLGNRIFPDGLAPALTESPLKALQGNQDLPIFVGGLIAAVSPKPAFNFYDSNGAASTGDPLADAMALAAPCLQHDWGDAFPDGTGYHQKDIIDPGTFIISSSVILNTEGLAPVPKDALQFRKYPNDPSGSFTFAAGSSAFDQSSTRQAMLNAVMGVDLSKIVNGQQIPVTRPFPGTAGQAPYVSGYQFYRFDADLGGLTASADGGFYEIPGAGFTLGQISTSTDITIKSGIDTGFNLGFGSGYSVVRAFLQARNIAGTPVELNFLESYGGRLLVNGEPQFFALYRPAGGTVLAKDTDIADVPLPSIQSFPANIGGYALTQGGTLILFGQTIDQYFAERGITNPIMI